MKTQRLVIVLVSIIAIGSAICSSIGVASNNGPGLYSFTSINGEEVSIYGKGIYKNESLSMASQVIAQDYVILIMGIPALLISLFFAMKSLKGLKNCFYEKPKLKFTGIGTGIGRVPYAIKFLSIM